MLLPIHHLFLLSPGYIHKDICKVPAPPLINQVHKRAGVPDYISITLDNLYAECGSEFAWEGGRRNDLFRLGRFDDPWKLETDTDPDPDKNLLPIPAA
jgi:hypothetical protein